MPALDYQAVEESAASRPSKQFARYWNAVEQSALNAKMRSRDEEALAQPQPSSYTGKPRFALPDGPAIVDDLSVARDFFFARNEWDGYVTSVSSDSFTAVIYPLGEAAGRQDLLEAPLNEIAPAERHRVVEGAVFRLSAGRLVRHGSYSQLTKLYFRSTTGVGVNGSEQLGLTDLFA